MFSLSFHPQDERILVAGRDLRATEWDLATKSERGIPIEYCTIAAYDDDGDSIAAASPDGRFRLIEAETRGVLAIFVGHTDTIQTIEFDATGRLLISTSRDATARLWSVANQSSVYVGRIVGFVDGRCRSARDRQDPDSRGGRRLRLVTA